MHVQWIHETLDALVTSSWPGASGPRSYGNRGNTAHCEARPCVSPSAFSRSLILPAGC